MLGRRCSQETVGDPWALQAVCNMSELLVSLKSPGCLGVLSGPTEPSQDRLTVHFPEAGNHYVATAPLTPVKLM